MTSNIKNYTNPDFNFATVGSALRGNVHYTVAFTPATGTVNAMVQYRDKESKTTYTFK